MRIVILCVVLLALPAIAEDRKHTIGGVFDAGVVYSHDAERSDDAITGVGLFYDYKLNSRYSISVIAAETASFCIVTCSEDLYQYYDLYQVSMKAMKPLSQRWGIYGRLGANAYQLKFNSESRSGTKGDRDDSSGLGIVAAGGFEMNAANGFRLGLEFQDVPMSGVELRTLQVTVGYSF